MGKGKRGDKKEISAGTTVKAVITGYIAYGILIGFIVAAVVFVVNWTIGQMPYVDHRALSITLPILGICLLYFVIHGVCKLSIYDVFRECRTNPDRMERILTRLNLFILIHIQFYDILVEYYIVSKHSLEWYLGISNFLIYYYILF